MSESNNQDFGAARLYLDEDAEDTITLSLEDGDVECGIVASFPLNGKDYVALLPLSPVEGLEEDEILLYAYTKENDEFQLIEIEDDTEFDAVADYFDELLDEAAFNETETNEGTL